jgi:hypothetical protein
MAHGAQHAHEGERESLLWVPCLMRRRRRCCMQQMRRVCLCGMRTTAMDRIQRVM